ncbi:MAG: hypothetical protein ACREQV_06960 [Candidatus Binatia bacterium]
MSGQHIVIRLSQGEQALGHVVVASGQRLAPMSRRGGRAGLAWGGAGISAWVAPLRSTDTATTPTPTA